jgi:hypothetical protein
MGTRRRRRRRRRRKKKRRRAGMLVGDWRESQRERDL